VAFPQRPSTVGDSTRGQFAHIGQARPPPHPLSASLPAGGEKDYTVTHHLYHHYGGGVGGGGGATGIGGVAVQPPTSSTSAPAFDGSRSLPVRLADLRSTDTQTTPSISGPGASLSASLQYPSMRDQREEKRGTREVRSMSRSPPQPLLLQGQGSSDPNLPPPRSPTMGYDRLHDLVADTVSLSRAALDSSPPRRRTTSPKSTTRKTSPSTMKPPHSKPPQQRAPKRTDHLRSSTGTIPRQPAKKPQGILSTKSGVVTHGPNRRKVSFLTTRGLSSDEVASTDTSLDLGRGGSTSRRGVLGQIDNDVEYDSRSGRRRTTARKDPAARPSESAPALPVPPPSKRNRALSSTTEDESYYSDGCVDYGADRYIIIILKYHHQWNDNFEFFQLAFALLNTCFDFAQLAFLLNKSFLDILDPVPV
jgi:hypothetical protein